MVKSTVCPLIETTIKELAGVKPKRKGIAMSKSDGLVIKRGFFMG